MENKRRIFRVITALIALAVVATMCVLLVACDPEGKKGGETVAGCGDAIFTEDATLAELTEKINAAESFVLSSKLTVADSKNGTYVSKWEYRLDGEACYFAQQYDIHPDYNEYSYIYSVGDYDYFASVEEGGSIRMTKSLSKYGAIKALVAEEFERCKKTYMLDYLKEVDGKIVLNEDTVRMENGDYVEGSGYVKLKGDSLEYGYKLIEEYIDGTIEYDCVKTLSLVNAYSFEVTPELKEAEKTATWAEYVSYNGVNYCKAVGETTGEEYYYVDSADDGAVAETTINTLPVKPRQ